MSVDKTIDGLKFYDRHVPTVRSGVYRLQVTQNLTYGTTVGFTTVSEPLDFCFEGPQFTLPPNTISSVFPAVNANGDFAAVLPHMILKPASLPWERKSGSDVAAPWLVLLVLDSTEMQRVTVDKKKLSALPSQIDAAHELAPDGADTLIPVISFSGEDAKEFLPKQDELPWLAHVRASADAPEVAVIVAARRPSPSSVNHVFLVSVENRYKDGLDVAEQMTFPVLHRWSFACQAEHAHGFASLLADAVDRSSIAAELALPVETDDPLEAERYAQGLLPMRLNGQFGQTIPAWYHGPLRPRAASSKQADVQTHVTTDTSDDPLPVRRASDLTSTDTAFDMPQSGYAAAWELGRLIALQHSDIATSIYAWKRHYVQCCAHHQNQSDAPASLSCFLMDHFGTPEDCACLPQNVGRWIDESLFNLAEVPFRYLVPDQDMLPSRAIRFFDVDPFWLDVLRDGALSLGRVDSHTLAHEKQMRKGMGPAPKLSGFLLRSELVADFPDLLIDGYAEGDAPDDSPHIGEDGKKLRIVRREKLSNSVLLVLFDGTLDTLYLHLNPQALHFEVQSRGFNELENILSKYRKSIGDISRIAPQFEPLLDNFASCEFQIKKHFWQRATNSEDTFLRDALRIIATQEKQHVSENAKTDDLHRIRIGLVARVSVAMSDLRNELVAFANTTGLRGNNVPATLLTDGAVAEFAKGMLTKPPLVRFSRKES